MTHDDIHRWFKLSSEAIALCGFLGMLALVFVAAFVQIIRDIRQGGKP